MNETNITQITIFKKRFVPNRAAANDYFNYQMIYGFFQ